uniref:Protein translocase subunit SecA n=1 Tax=Dicranema revolutum TaxID=239144 RepID=A0A4D6WX16_9FLOR|nr:Preprotein-translocase subunit a [Dicranema revolutum]
MLNFLRNINNKKFQKLIQKIKKFDSTLSNYSNERLKQQTKKLKTKLASGKKINEILPEAFATAKEATKRAIGLEMFDVQLLAGIVLHEGKIAEMKTGEGKTIAAISPCYLNILNNSSVYVVTVNDYLAKRDAKLVSQVYEYLDIKVGLIQQSMNNIERKKEYQCNVIYTTNHELGFDYLRDNMAIELTKTVQRKLDFAIIDEVDSILIDEARTPLIISGPSKTPKNKYIKTNTIVQQLNQNIDYEIDEKNKNVILTDEGIKFCERLLKTTNLYNLDNPWMQYILNALKAKELFFNNIHYIIQNEEIIIVDEFTGRIMEGRRWSDGLHQAIETKENLPIQAENQILASITYQNLFLLYNKLSGMTGTAKTEETEFDKIYYLEVEEIPTNKTCQRKDLPDLVYKNEYSKWKAIAYECYDMHKIGRPTLIGTTSVEKSEFLASILDEMKIPYRLLNAKPENIAREAEIITQAGRKSAITISTNMAGRGTDIILGGNPYIMTKLTLTNYIKELLHVQPKHKLNNVEKNIYSYLQELEIKNIQKDININYKNIEAYVEEQINIIKKHKDNIDNNFQKTYSKVLNEYKIICLRDKEEILRLGGLHVIGTERHESRRIDNQLKGRSGRQGDSGSSRFFLSLEDKLLRIFGGNKISNLMNVLNINDNVPIESSLLSKSLDTAQRKVEAYFYDIRKQVFEYDEVINNQRQAIYAERKRVLQSTFTRDCIIEYGEITIDEIILLYNNLINVKDRKNFLNKITQLLNITNCILIEELLRMNNEQIKNFFYEQLHITYDLRESYLEQLKPGLTRKLEKYYLLQQIDQGWQEHLEKMTILKESIGLRSYGQQDPLIEYKNEGFKLFLDMISYIRQTIIYLIMRSRLIIN